MSKISKPLWSVGKLCDAGCNVEFGKDEARVVHAETGKDMGKFQRHKGLYIGNLELRTSESDESFRRPA